LAETFIGDIEFTNVTDIAFNQSGELFGCTYNYLLYIDPDTGKGSLIGSIGFTTNALAFNHNGILYGATTIGALITIDTSTGKGSYISSFGGGLISSGDLIFSPDGKLYATARYSFGSNYDYLAIINTSTGTANIIGNIGFDKVYGLAYDKNGNLYGFTDYFELLSINTSTGSGVLLGYLDSNAWGGTSKVVKQYTLTISANEGGTTDPSPGTHIYDKGTEVAITATPDSGYRFKEWSGDITGENNPIKITMDSDKSIKANFIRQYTLSISAGAGGTTDPAPGAYTYDTGTQVTIRAISNSGYRFSGWSGAASGTTNPITTTMDADKSITANFIRQYTLTIAAGTGGTTNPSPGTYTHDSGTQVSITAIPNSGYQFSGWSGDASGTTNPITITVDNDKSVTANFTAIPKPPEEGKKGGCFIATAAYGSPFHPYVNILRDFRDKYLMTTKLGRVLVGLYYKYSQSVADLIAKSKMLKVAVRISLLPMIAFSYSMLHFGPIITAAIFVFIFVLPIFLFSFFKKKQPHHSINSWKDAYCPVQFLGPVQTSDILIYFYCLLSFLFLNI
jgi:uncharacterized repeat protein (TIGR02543 family)